MTRFDQNQHGLPTNLQFLRDLERNVPQADNSGNGRKLPPPETGDVLEDERPRRTGTNG